jgi:hypothetical protein
MAIPGYAAETSLYTASGFYRVTYSLTVADITPMLIAQHDPCAMPGDGERGGTPPPSRCRSGTKCCGRTVNGICYGQCVPNSFQCP